MELNKLCYIGDLQKIKDFVEFLDGKTLSERLAKRSGALGYTPLHEAVASGKADVLDYLLSKANNAHVNCRDISGYTPLHLAASTGHLKCVRRLLEHSADMFITDKYGKTPKQTAELNSRTSTVRLLRSEGEPLSYSCKSELLD